MGGDPGKSNIAFSRRAMAARGKTEDVKLLFPLLWALACTAQQPSFDILITSARVIDGAGTPWFRADIGIRGDRIAAIGQLQGASAKLRIDARGLAAAPGFIDIHSHAARDIPRNPGMEGHLRQGITSVLDGNDGGGPLPLAPALRNVAEARVAINVGYFAGHNAIRSHVMGVVNRAPTEAELARMKQLTQQTMREGAFGLSTGLFYVPGNYARTEEVIALARIAGAMGGMHISHMRDEAANVRDSVRETIRIGEEGSLPTQITHHKIIGKAYWGSSRDTLRLVEEARARGVDVTIDQYPYTASSTGTAALFPQWSLEGGAASLAERMRAPEAREKIRAEIIRRIKEDRGGGDPANIQFARCSFDPALDGRTLADATRARGVEPTPENAAETALEIQAKGGCSAIYHAIAEEDVARIMQSHWTMIASDGDAPVPGEQWPHPRSYGTFPRVLGRYVREKKLLTLEDAIRRMTGFPATRLKLQDRGFLRPGMYADIVIFDPATIIDRSEFSNPHLYSDGVHTVLVNGTPALLDGKVTGARAGRPLHGPAADVR